MFLRNKMCLLIQSLLKNVFFYTIIFPTCLLHVIRYWPFDEVQRKLFPTLGGFVNTKLDRIMKGRRVGGGWFK